jgi:hypothetical protein
VIYGYRYLKTRNEYIETDIVSGDKDNITAWGLAHPSDGYYKDAATKSIDWDQTVNSLVDNTLRDASEIIEHYTTTVYTDIIFDCHDYRGLVHSQRKSTGCTFSILNSVAPNTNYITSLRGLNTAEPDSNIPNSTQIISDTDVDNILFQAQTK